MRMFTQPLMTSLTTNNLKKNSILGPLIETCAEKSWDRAPKQCLEMNTYTYVHIRYEYEIRDFFLQNPVQRCFGIFNFNENQKKLDPKKGNEILDTKIYIFY